MRPLDVITGILLGSCLSITVSLAAVMLVFFTLGDEYPRFAHEFNDLVKILSIFLVLTAISAMSFYTLLKGNRSRWWLQALMWSAFATSGLYFWA